MSRFKETAGFTLVEIMVVAPVVILVISGFVALIIVLTGDVLLTSETNKIAYSVKDAGSSFEQDARLTTQFLSTSSTPATGSKQGVNDSSSPFTTPSAVIMNVLATNKNPLDPTRELVYVKDSPYACSDPNVTQNTPFSINVIYFATSTAGKLTIWRRVLFDQSYNAANLCSTVWQQPSCSNTTMTTEPVPAICKTEDRVILQNATQFVASWFTSPLLNVAASPGTANTAYLQLAASKSVAGRQASYSYAFAVTKINTP